MTSRGLEGYYKIVSDSGDVELTRSIEECIFVLEGLLRADAKEEATQLNNNYQVFFKKEEREKSKMKPEDFNNMQAKTRLFLSKDAREDEDTLTEILFMNGSLWLSAGFEGVNVTCEELTEERVNELISILSAWKEWRNGS